MYECADGLDMGGVRKQVDDGQVLEPHAYGAQQARISGEGARFASDQHEQLWIGAHKGVHACLPQALACRISDHDRGRLRLPTLDRSVDDLHVATVEVDSGIGERVPAPFDRIDGPTLTDRSGEDPDAGIGIDQGSLLSEPAECIDHRGNFCDECVDPGGAVLEERARRDAPTATGRLLMDPGPPTTSEVVCADDEDIVGNGEVLISAGDQHQSVAGAVANADRDFVGAAEVTLDKDLGT